MSEFEITFNGNNSMFYFSDKMILIVSFMHVWQNAV